MCMCMPGSGSEPAAVHAVWIDEMSVSRSFRPGLARAISHMYRVSVMPVYSHTSGKTGTATDLRCSTCSTEIGSWEIWDGRWCESGDRGNRNR